MQYAMLIYSDEAKEPKPGTKEFDDYMGAYFAFSDEVKKNGMFQFGEALEGVAAATTVQVRDGQTTTIDGPFAETKEQLGAALRSRMQGSRRSDRICKADPDGETRLDRDPAGPEIRSGMK